MTFQILGVCLVEELDLPFYTEQRRLLIDPLMIFYVWQGGMASHGGFIGVVIATFWYTRKISSVLLASC